LFFDDAKIYVKAGDGGNGCVSFRREKFVPFGGPNGGDGGRGGDVYLAVDPHLNTLINFKHKRHFKAPRGAHGQGKERSGRDGSDLVIPVPPGTVVRAADTGDMLGDLVELGQRLLVAHGGRGGRGNAAFATPTQQAPRFAEKGEPGEECWLVLELKLIADVGIVGVPNAGKSTLLAATTAAKPKIAAYPFTTLEPNLGVVALNDESFVLADIPGLIEGAHRGAGLGHQFLRHIQRTRVLIHLLDGIAANPLRDFEDINAELALFDPKLAETPQVVALNKIDLPEVQERWPTLRTEMQAKGVALAAISAMTGQGVKELMRRVAELLASLPKESMQMETPIAEDENESTFAVVCEDEAWRVCGKRMERAAAMTDWNNEEAVARFQRLMTAMGVKQALRQAGVRDGDTVRIGRAELEWLENEG
jgi:GTP-binding protein